MGIKIDYKGMLVDKYLESKKMPSGNRPKVIENIYQEWLEYRRKKPIYMPLEYKTLWLNKDGHLKLRLTQLLPKVQYYMNPRHSNISRHCYKDVEIGDIDYYGWICIDIEINYLSVPRKKMEVIQIKDYQMSPADYVAWYQKYVAVKKKK